MADDRHFEQETHQITTKLRMGSQVTLLTLSTVKICDGHLEKLKSSHISTLA